MKFRLNQYDWVDGLLLLIILGAISPLVIYLVIHRGNTFAETTDEWAAFGGIFYGVALVLVTGINIFVFRQFGRKQVGQSSMDDLEKYRSEFRDMTARMWIIVKKNDAFEVEKLSTRLQQFANGHGVAFGRVTMKKIHALSSKLFQYSVTYIPAREAIEIRGFDKKEILKKVALTEKEYNKMKSYYQTTVRDREEITGYMNLVIRRARLPI